MNIKKVIKSGDSLILVDIQNDFCPGGALPIKGGHEVVPVLNQWINEMDAGTFPIYASRDWHPLRHISFKNQGGQWPMHCVQDTEGAAFHPDLRLPDNVIKVTKGVRFDQDQNSAFDQTGLTVQLQRDGVKRLWIGGLALDVCVLATALDGRKVGYPVNIILDGTRPVSTQNGREAIAQMKEMGINIYE